jgi:hypothetical protein
MVGMFHCLFIVLRIPLFSISFSHDSVIRMFHCLFIVLKIPLYSMPSSHDPVIRMFHCLFIVLKIPLFSIPPSCSLLLYKYLSLMLRNDPIKVQNGLKKYINGFNGLMGSKNTLKYSIFCFSKVCILKGNSDELSLINIGVHKIL